MSEENKESKFSSNAGKFLFLSSVGVFASIGGFSMVISKTRKSSPADFDKGLLIDNASKLAMKALGRATIYSVGSFSIFCFSIWKLMGVKNLEEFTKKMQSIMPKVPPAKISEDRRRSWEDIFSEIKKEEK